ncbi:MAG TPA: hypothetical protein PLU30_23005 [Verrucomicrobiae bacterium]|nr:hypothetical protein [Verrucomicrobiae bacterium]
MNVFRSGNVPRWLANVARWAALGLVSDVNAFAGDSNNDRWDREVRLPDSYLPGGFIRDKSNSSSRTIFSADGGGNEHTTYTINTTAWVSNQELSPKPGDGNCPFGPGLFKELRPIRFGEAQGYWSVEQIQSSYLDVSCIFKSGPLVGYLCLHSKATHWNGRAPTVPRPSEGQVLETLQKFVEAYSKYVRDQKWTTAPRVPPTHSTADGGRSRQPPAVAADEPVPPAANPERVIPGGLDGDLETVPVFAVGSVAVGILTALGAGLMMLGTGVNPRDIIGGAMELFDGTSSPATAVEPLTVEQRGTAAKILGQGWQNVSPEELEALRTSPKWLKEAMKQTVPAVAIEGYQPSLWREGATAGLKAAQTYIDAAVGIFSATTGNLPMAVHYTYWKNTLGGTSEGVADWVWGKNDRGLIRNVAEGFARGGIKGGVELAVDLATGKAIHNPVVEYAPGQVGKYAVGAAGDVAVDALDPPGTKGRPLRAEGFFDTTSPLEKDALDALLSPGNDSGGMSVPSLPYMAQNLIY